MKQQNDFDKRASPAQGTKFMSTPRYKTQFHNNERSVRGRVTTLPSVAIPDQSYTVKELLTRFTSGTMPPVMKRPSYDENPNINEISFPDFSRMDMTEIDDYERKLQTKINNAKNTLQNEYNKQHESKQD